MPLPAGAVTFAFTDVVGSTAIARQLGDDAFREVLAVHAAVIEAAADEANGVVVLTEGDSFFVAFQDAADGVRFATRVQQAFATQAMPHAATVRVRIGLHTGPAVIDGDTYIGLAVHLAARISSAAHGGQVLVSADTALAVAGRAEDEVVLVDVGRHALKDFPDAVALLQANPRSAPDQRFAPLRTRAHVPTNLPAARTALTGRADDLSRVTKLLAANRLVTLTGVGGTGKTSLALEAARAALDEYPDGVWFVDLGPVTDAIGVERAVAAPLGVRADAYRSTLDAIAAALARRRAMLVVDNAEHLLDPTAVVLDRLLDECPYLSLLVTSREPVNVRGEQVCRIPPLDRLPAQDLFVERARQHDDRFERREANAAEIETICDLVDGLPLAIELAAARTASLDLDELVVALGDRLGALGSGPRTSSERQRTLRGAIEWSFDLLDPVSLSALAQLAVLRSPFDRAVGAEIATVSDGDLDAAVDRLVRASLLEESPNGKLRLLETIRAAVDEREGHDAERDDARRRHAAYFGALAVQAEPTFSTCAEAHEDLLAALDYLHAHDRDQEREVAVHLAPFWSRRGHIATGLERLLLALEDRPDAGLHNAVASLADIAAQPALSRQHAELALERARRVGNVEAEAAALLTLAAAESERGDFARSIELCDEGRAAAERAGDDRRIRQARRLRARAMEFTGHVEEAQQEMQAVLEESLASGDDEQIGVSAFALGALAERRGDAKASLDYYLLAESTARTRDDLVGVAEALSGIGIAHSYLGNSHDARAALERAIAIAATHGDVRNEATWSGNLGMVLQATGDLDGAAERYQAALAMARDVGDRPNELTFLGQLGAIAYLRADYEVARDRLSRALAIAQELGMVHAMAIVSSNIANVDLVQGDWEAAEAAYAASIEAWEQLDNRRSLGLNLGNRGLVAIALGRFDEAERFVQRARAIAEEIGNRRGVGLQEGSLGTIARYRGRPDEARQHFEAARAVAAELEDPHNEGMQSANLALLALTEGDLSDAASLCGAALEMVEAGSPSFLDAVELAARVLLASGRREAAARLVAAAQGERRRLRTAVTPVEQAATDQLVAAVADVATEPLEPSAIAAFAREALGEL